MQLQSDRSDVNGGKRWQTVNVYFSDCPDQSVNGFMGVELTNE